MNKVKVLVSIGITLMVKFILLDTKFSLKCGKREVSIEIFKRDKILRAGLFGLHLLAYRFL